MNFTVYAGTVGQGVWRSLDAGESFSRCSNGMFMEAQVRALCVHPTDAKTLYAGTEAGLYHTQNGGDNWARLDTPFDPGEGWQGGVVIWSMAIDPVDPNRIIVGTCPPSLYLTEDAGGSWTRLSSEMTQLCPPIRYNRVTSVVFDDDKVWAGVEIDGLWHSSDRGATWGRFGECMSSQDIHSIQIVPGSPRRLLACTNNDLNLSVDEGQTWVPQGVAAKFGNGYCRSLSGSSADPNLVFLGNGNGPPGTLGTLQISRDGGVTWAAASLPVVPNSTIWDVAICGDVVFAISINGYVYRSVDKGVTWAKCRHEFGEVRTIAVV